MTKLATAQMSLAALALTSTWNATAWVWRHAFKLHRVMKERKTMFKDFDRVAKSLRNEYLLKTESMFFMNLQNWSSVFAVHLDEVFINVHRLQLESAISSISYLEYTMLYTNFINRKYNAELLAFNHESYLDKKQLIIGSLDISFLFIPESVIKKKKMSRIAWRSNEKPK